MMKRFKSLFAAGLMTLVVAAGIVTFAAPNTQAAANATGKCAQSFLTLPTWFRGLTKSDTDCNLKSPAEFNSTKPDGTKDNDGLSNYIWHIVLNVIDIVLQAIAYITFFMILFGGFQFLTSAGNASGIEAGRKTILNASIGFVIAIAAVAIDNKLFDIFTGVTGTAQLGGSATTIVKASATDIVVNILDIAYFLAGAIAIIIIIVSGLFYVTSGGNSTNISRAKNTLTYAIVGLVVIALAFIITRFIGSNFA